MAKKQNLTFQEKLGYGLGDTASNIGYQANVEQTDQALFGILIAFAGSSVVAAALVIVCLQFYRLTRGWQQRMGPAEAIRPEAL